jgi:hypothetical protein
MSSVDLAGFVGRGGANVAAFMDEHKVEVQPGYYPPSLWIMGSHPAVADAAAAVRVWLKGRDDRLVSRQYHVPAQVVSTPGASLHDLPSEPQERFASPDEAKSTPAGAEAKGADASLSVTARPSSPSPSPRSTADGSKGDDDDGNGYGDGSTHDDEHPRTRWGHAVALLIGTCAAQRMGCRRKVRGGEGGWGTFLGR